MLERRGFEIVEIRFCMRYFSRFLLAHWRPLPGCPRTVVRKLAVLDRLVPIGPPMDLVVLAQLAAKPSAA
jgi:hypothetical protein